MYYNPPEENGNPYYVPIVAKNKDLLIGYLRGINDGKILITEALESVNIDIDFGPVDVILDSTRFNDILEDGRRESELSRDELAKYINDTVEILTNKMLGDNSENNIKRENVLDVECSCGLGYYAWRTYDDIPEESFKCTNCGKVLIDYCGKYDHEYDFQEGETKNDRQEN